MGCVGVHQLFKIVCIWKVADRFTYRNRTLLLNRIDGGCLILAIREQEKPLSVLRNTIVSRIQNTIGLYNLISDQLERFN